MAVVVVGNAANFHVLFVDGDNNPVTMATATIEVFTFTGTTKVQLVNAGTNMTAVSGDTGRYVYVYSVASNYSNDPNIYAKMTGTDALGTKYVVEQLYEVLDSNGVPIEPPPPTPPLSHWNTNDGNNGNQGLASASGLSFTTARIPTPSGGEGTPFAVGTWGNTTQNRVTRDTTATVTSGGDTTGFGGDSVMLIIVYDADGTTPLESYTTGVLSANASHTSPSGGIVVTISNYGADEQLHLKAKASVALNFTTLLGAGRSGGKIGGITIRHTVDSATDGTGSYDFTYAAFYIDSNPTSASISGAVSFTQNTIVSKHLSGIQYYIKTSTFTVGVTGIDQLNRNSAKSSNNLNITATGINLATLNQCPFGAGSGNFSGWTSDENVDGVSYSKSDWEVTQNNYRLLSGSSKATAKVKDTWSTSASLDSPSVSLLIDTYGVTSTSSTDSFDDEDRRLESDYTTPWNSGTALVAGEALVIDSKLRVPYNDWSSFLPNQGGNNPDYSGIGSAPASYFRTVETDSPTVSYSQMTVVVSGTFVSSLEDDLVNEDLKIFVRRKASATGGNTGTAAPPLLIHGQEYNFTLFDDGASNGYIRTGVSGGTISCTFGYGSTQQGIYLEIMINNTSIVLDSVSFTFS